MSTKPAMPCRRGGWWPPPAHCPWSEEAMQPSRISMSSRTSLRSPVGRPARRRPGRPVCAHRPANSVAGRECCRSRRVSWSILPAHGAFVPAPEQQMGNEAEHQEDQDAGADTITRPRTCAEFSAGSPLRECGRPARTRCRPNRRRIPRPPRRSAPARPRCAGHPGNMEAPPAGAGNAGSASGWRRRAGEVDQIVVG